jgi:hypothetical protein
LIIESLLILMIHPVESPTIYGGDKEKKFIPY